MRNYWAFSGRRRRLEWLVLGVLMALLAAVLASALYRQLMEATQLEGDRLQGQARVVAENLNRQIEGVNSALAGIRSAVGPQPSGTRLADVATRLALLADAMPGVRTVAVLDAAGTVVASSKEELLGRNFRHREYFDVPRRFPDAAALYVSPPIKASVDGHAIFVGKALLDRNGRFAGIVAATLDPDYFDVVLRSVVYAADMRAMLVHADGKVFIDVPARAASQDMDLSAPGTIFSRFRQSGQAAHAVAASPFDHGEFLALRTVGAAALRMDKPLVAVLSRESPAVFSAWRDKTERFGAFFAVVLLASCAALHASQRRRMAISRMALQAAREREQAAASLTQAAVRLRNSEERLSLALEASGLALFDWNLSTNLMFHSAEAAAMRGEQPVDSETSPEAYRQYVHPDDLEPVLGRLRQVLAGREPVYHAEFRLRTLAGGWVWIRARGRVVERDGAGRALRLAGTYANVNDRKLAEAKLRRLAEFDALTELPNRAQFLDRLQQALLRAGSGRPMAVLFLDIDHFKTINDTLGHEAGDRLLKVFAQRMRASVRQADLVARLAGDEFTIIVEGLRDRGDAKAVAAKLVQVLREPVDLGGRRLRVTASIGIALSRPGEAEDAVLRRADDALYKAKRQGRDGCAFDDDGDAPADVARAAAPQIH